MSTLLPSLVTAGFVIVLLVLFIYFIFDGNFNKLFFNKHRMVLMLLALGIISFMVVPANALMLWLKKCSTSVLSVEKIEFVDNRYDYSEVLFTDEGVPCGFYYDKSDKIFYGVPLDLNQHANKRNQATLHTQKFVASLPQSTDGKAYIFTEGSTYVDVLVTKRFTNKEKNKTTNFYTVQENNEIVGKKSRAYLTVHKQVDKADFFYRLPATWNEKIKVNFGDEKLMLPFVEAIAAVFGKKELFFSAKVGNYYRIARFSEEQGVEVLPHEQQVAHYYEPYYWQPAGRLFYVGVAPRLVTAEDLTAISSYDASNKNSNTNQQALKKTYHFEKALYVKNDDGGTFRLSLDINPSPNTKRLKMAGDVSGKYFSHLSFKHSNALTIYPNSFFTANNKVNLSKKQILIFKDLHRIYSFAFSSTKRNHMLLVASQNSNLERNAIYKTILKEKQKYVWYFNGRVLIIHVLFMMISLYLLWNFMRIRKIDYTNNNF